MPPGVSRREFAALVDETRRRRHLSIRAVARIAEVAPTTAAGWLNGQHFPTQALRGNYMQLLDHLGLVEAVTEELWVDPWRV